MTADNQLWHIH